MVILLKLCIHVNLQVMLIISFRIMFFSFLRLFMDSSRLLVHGTNNFPFLSSIGFHSCKFDCSFFTFHRGKDIIYLLLYVDDIILTPTSSALTSKVISCNSLEFFMTDFGPIFFFLGTIATWSNSTLFLSQSDFAQEILTRAYMITCNPCSTLDDTKSKLSSVGEPISVFTLYQSLA